MCSQFQSVLSISSPCYLLASKNVLGVMLPGSITVHSINVFCVGWFQVPGSHVPRFHFQHHNQTGLID